MKKIRLAFALLATIAVLIVSGCSIHENFHDGGRPWDWHDRHW